MKKLILNVFALAALSQTAFAGNKCEYTYDTESDIGEVSVQPGGECMDAAKTSQDIYLVYYTSAKYKSSKECHGAFADTQSEFSQAGSKLNKKAVEALTQARKQAVPTLLPAEAVFSGCYSVALDRTDLGAIIKNSAGIPAGPPKKRVYYYLLVTTLKYKLQDTAVNNPERQKDLIKSAEDKAKNLP